MSATKHTDVFTIITERVIKQLQDQRIIPWQIPWAEGGHPQNLFTKRPYTGINTWLLGSKGYTQNYFLTWKQIKTIGGNVAKGAKGMMVVYWERVKQEANDSQTSAEITSRLKYYFVFNIAHVEDIPDVVTIPYLEAIAAQFNSCEELVERMPNCPVIKGGKPKPGYNPMKDVVNIPKEDTFSSRDAYYFTLFMQLIHSTGHASRLNRKDIAEATSSDIAPYSMEALTAEIGACYLSSITGIVYKEFDASEECRAKWIETLRGNPKMIVYASMQAQQATDYILNVQSYQKSEEMHIEEKHVETQ